MAAVAKRYITPERYEELEERSDIRHEYFQGEMFAMAGATEQHNLITGNIACEIGNQFRDRPSVVFASNMRVKVRPTGLYTYPDVVAVCGPAEFEHDRRKTTLLNPTAIVEVLSGSTETYDRTLKLDHYAQVESLREVAIVAQDRVRVDLLRRGEAGWVWSSVTDPAGSFRLDSINCEISLSRVYEKVDLPDPLPHRGEFADED